MVASSFIFSSLLEPLLFDNFGKNAEFGFVFDLQESGC